MLSPKVIDRSVMISIMPGKKHFQDCASELFGEDYSNNSGSDKNNFSRLQNHVSILLMCPIVLEFPLDLERFR